MKNKKNVIIFVVDSARYYSTGGLDDRDKLEMMDRFEDQSIYFSTAVSSAPSSVMSCASMLTGLPAYYIARNYEDYKYDDSAFYSLQRVLKENNFEIRCNFIAREMRDKYGEILSQIEKSYWPSGLNDNVGLEKFGAYAWTNGQLNDVLRNFLNKRNGEKPLFLLNWYNIRLDPNTSKEVENGIQLLKENDLWDNTIFLLLSDHGYMDPKRGYTPEKLKEMGLTHDLVLFDDNIRIPFYLKYPGCEPKIIEDQVSTYDIYPTILDLLNIPMPKNVGYDFYGKSLLNIIDSPRDDNKHFKMVRTDGRFFAQNDRCTSIRSKYFKYIIRPDSKEEEFYDLSKDSFEENNVILENSYSESIEELKKYYKKTERDAIAFQTSYLISKLLRETNIGVYNDSMKKVLLLVNDENYYIKIISKVLSKVFDKCIFFILFIENKKMDKNKSKSGQNYFICNYDRNYGIDKSNVSNETNFDLIIEASSDKNHKFNSSSFLANKISYKKIIKIDSNMNMEDYIRQKNSFSYLFKTMVKKSNYYASNPSYFLTHLKVGLKRLLFNS